MNNMFWKKVPLTELDIIENELKRLHNELQNMTWDVIDSVDPTVKLFMEEISKLNNHLIELNKVNKNEINNRRF